MFICHHMLGINGDCLKDWKKVDFFLKHFKYYIIIDESGHGRVHTWVSDEVSQCNLDIIIPFLKKNQYSKVQVYQISSNFTASLKFSQNCKICLVSFKHLINCLHIKELLQGCLISRLSIPPVCYSSTLSPSCVVLIHKLWKISCGETSCCWDTVFLWVNTTPSIPRMCLDGLGPQSLGVDFGTLEKAINLDIAVDSGVN